MKIILALNFILVGFGATANFVPKETCNYSSNSVSAKQHFVVGFQNSIGKCSIR
ncbi:MULTISPECIES: hypothetical protein [Helicobacter]|nr:MULTISPECIES: hypothetical protein [Helicobacter]